MIEENKKIVQRYYHELWNLWDYSLIDEIISEAFMFRGSIGTATQGRDGFKEYMNTIRTAFPDFLNTIEDLIAETNIEMAREQVASLLSCPPSEIIFTSGGSESDTLAIRGAALAAPRRGQHIITQVTEHPAVLTICRALTRLYGFRVTYLPVDASGRVKPADVEAAIDDQTTLVSIMHANNETGTVQPIVEIAEIAHRHGALMHTDASQSVGKIATDIAALGVDLLTVAGHKLYAPKGVGALYVRRGVQLEPINAGGGQEKGLRAGTENVAAIVALGAACEQAQPPHQRCCSQWGWSGHVRLEHCA